MALADTSRSALRYLAESSWGVIPSAALTDLRITGEGLNDLKETRRSARIRPDRQAGKMLEVFRGAGGDTNHELSYGGEWLRFLPALLMADSLTNWTTPVAVTGSSDISFAAAGKTITKSGASFNTQFVVGQKVRVHNTTSNGTLAAPKYFTITALSATVITVAETVVDESNTSAKLSGSMVRNGVTEYSHVLERQPTDLSSVFLAFTGMEIANAEFNIQAKEIVTARLGWLGKLGQQGTATVGTGSHTAAATTEEFNATRDVGTLLRNGSALTTPLSAIRINVNNALRDQPAIGSRYNIGIGKGTLDITGTINAYWDGLTLYDDYDDHDVVGLTIPLFDTSLQGYIITLPALRFTSDDTGPDAKDQDGMEDIEFAAEPDNSLSYTIQIDKFAAPA